MIKRKRYSKLPIQANFYPLPSMGYIQDSGSRLSLISGQPLGGTSGSSGQLEVMLDRRLMQDDNRGLFQGVQDNRVTPHHFVLLLERQIPGSKVLLSFFWRNWMYFISIHRMIHSQVQIKLHILKLC